MASLKEVQKLGQSIWLDFISRDLIIGGKLKKLVDEGLTGVTTNPTIFNKAIAQSADYDDSIRNVLRKNPGATCKEVCRALMVEDIQAAADILRPVFNQTKGVDGFISLEASPALAYDTQGTLAEAQELWKAASRPNVLIKIPATEPGIPTIEELTARDININITLMFSMKHYEAVARAYMNGVTRARKPDKITSVASFFVSRVDTYTDKELEKIGTPQALALRGKTAIANCKVVYSRFQELFYGTPFESQRRRCARVQRVLWGSTSTKNPAYPDVLYVDNLIGKDTTNTLPMETLEAFRDHGKAKLTLTRDLDAARLVLADLKKVGINLDSITEQIQKDGVKAFTDSFDQLMAALEKKVQELRAKSK